MGEGMAPLPERPAETWFARTAAWVSPLMWLGAAMLFGRFLPGPAASDVEERQFVTTVVPIFVLVWATGAVLGIVGTLGYRQHRRWSLLVAAVLGTLLNLSNFGFLAQGYFRYRAAVEAADRGAR
jgi:hypothetical protein